MTTRISAVLLCAVAALSCGVPEESVQEGEPIGVFVESPCPVPIPEGLVEGESIRCGTVAVPEFHDRPDGRRLHLSVAVFPSIGGSPSPDPLFVATAGPGASGIESITPEITGPLGPALLSQRDLVLIDYRGLPLADPNLMCPEITESMFQDLGEDVSGEEFMRRQIERAAACRDRFIADGVNLAAFDNAETAADIALVMDAIGYERFNVYGTSAGTILAQHLLRDFPDRLRSVVIDSTVPAGRSNVHIETAAIAAEILDAVIRHCEEDEACATAYPNLRAETAGLIDRYTAEPASVEVTHPSTGDPFTMVLNGHRVAQALLMLNSQTPTVPLMPWFIHKLAARETDIIPEFLWTIAPPPGNFSWGLGASVFCMEYSGFSEDEIFFPGIFPSYEEAVTTQGFGARTISRMCEIWGVDAIDPQLKTPVPSDVPVLLMAGELDSLTPPRWAQEVAETLSNAYVFEVPGYAHSPTFGGECTAMMALQFYGDPTQAPDASCLEALKIAFVVGK